MFYHSIKLFACILLFFIFNIETLNAATLSGAVNENQVIQIGKGFKVVDSQTGNPISNAVVSMPSLGIKTKTNSDGYFTLNANLNGPVILGINADGYNPFSITIDKEGINKPLTIGLSKNESNILVVDETLRHLGDNNFSLNSANAFDFQKRATGPTFSKKFYVGSFAQKDYINLKIGSIIGLDTLISKKLSGANINSYSTPASIYLNGQKIGEIRINGDNQQIKFLSNLLIQNSYNEITIQTGQNEIARYTDFDDIEFMNILISFN